MASSHARRVASRTGTLPAFFIRVPRDHVPDLSPEFRSLTPGVRNRALAIILRLRLLIVPILGSFALTFAVFEPVTLKVDSDPVATRVPV